MSDLFSLPEFSEQEELLRLEPVERAVASAVPAPVAKVVVDVPHIHMGSVFDYEVPEKFADVPLGARVIVDVGANRVSGFIVDRVDRTRFGTGLRPIHKVVSAQPVVDPAIYVLAQKVAERQSSTVAQCFKLAIPQRHARAEKEFLAREYADLSPIAAPESGPWAAYEGGPILLERLQRGDTSRALVHMRSVDTVADLCERIVQASASGSHGVIVVFPTARQAKGYAEALSHALGQRVATMVAEDSPEERYRTFLEVKNGYTNIVVGTRNAAWAPVQNLGLVVIIDDHHRSHIELHNPYIHTRDLLLLRSVQADCSFVALNYGPSVELVASTASNVVPVVPLNGSNPHSVPQVIAASALAYEGEQWSRMPSSVFTVVRSGLERGNVLIVVPRTGYIPVVACARCRELASCPVCDGRIQIDGPGQPPRCSRCATIINDFTCRHCKHHHLKPVRIGSHRTAQEIGRAFRGVPIHVAGISEEIAPSTDENRIVIATPGALPRMPEPFSAVVVLDAGYLLRSEKLDAEVYFLRSLTHIATTVAPRADGGQMLIVGDVPGSLMLTLKKWDMYGWAMKALNERRELSLPPAYVWTEVTGTMDTLRHYLSILQAFAQQAGFVTEKRLLATLLGTGAQELIPGMRVVGPYPGKDTDDLHVYLTFPETAREAITPVIAHAHKTFSVQKLGRITIKIDTSV